MALPEFALKAGREQYSWEMSPQVPRGVVPGGAGVSMAPLDFGRSVNPISTNGDRLFPPNSNGTPGFSDIPTALECRTFSLQT